MPLAYDSSEMAAPLAKATATFLLNQAMRDENNETCKKFPSGSEEKAGLMSLSLFL